MTASNKQSTPVTPTAEGRGAEWIAILRQYWGYDSFRGIQLDIINSIASGHDTLGLMPTGGGKSITFQVPTMAMEGLCLVVTPLIALMKDQVQNLRQRGIMAAAIYSGQTRSEVVQHLDNAIFGAYKFLYVSPERLTTEIFMNKVRRMKVCLITVDEAHCISQWGYDFRPHYLRIAEVRKLLPGVPVLALTATATRMVVDDIQQKLAFVDGQVYKMSFARPNLHYIVRPTGDKFAELLHILQCVDGSAIVYTRSRNGTREVADKLNEAGIEHYLPYAQVSSSDGVFGNGLWSATPLADPADDDVNSSASFMPGGTVDMGGQQIRFVSVHTTAPVPGYWRQWKRSLDELGLMRGHTDTRYIFMGDFNATYDHTPFRDFLGDRFVDAARESGHGFTFSWPTNRAAVPMFAGIDHVVLDQGMKAGQCKVVKVEGSDHAALLATVAVG